MSFTISSLSFPWNAHLENIEQSSRFFWERRSWPPDPIRLQGMDVWQGFRRVLGRITSELVPKTHRLTESELFLLHAAASLYEIGWQTPYGLRIPVKRRYIESGCFIRNSTISGSQLDLSYLEAPTLNALACISSAPGFDDLSAFPSSPEPVGFGETVDLRYLAALFQLADFLFIGRVNKRTMQKLTDYTTLDPLSARLLLQPYLPFVYIQPDGVTASFTLHPDDAHLAEKVQALFADPINLWRERNAFWLKEEFDFSFTLHTSRINIIKSAAVPDPLAINCEALLSFLEQYTPLSFASKEENTTRAPSSLQASTIPTFSNHKDAEIVQGEANPKRTKAFICYSHTGPDDRRYLEELRKHLKPYDIDVWDTSQIAVGANRLEEINRALDTTKVAIMLVSADFLASDFVVRNELLPLLTAAEKEGAIIVSVVIGPCAFKRSPLFKFETVNSPDRPLNLLHRRGERDIVWNKVAELVKDALSKLS